MKHLLNALPTLLLIAMVYALSATHSPVSPLTKIERESTIRELHQQLQTTRTQLEYLKGQRPPSLPRGMSR